MPRAAAITATAIIITDGYDAPGLVFTLLAMTDPEALRQRRRRASRRAIKLSNSTWSSWFSFGPGALTVADPITPRRRRISLRSAKPTPACYSCRTTGR